MSRVNVESALGQLIKRLIEDDARAPAEGAEEVILDLEVDGIRYLAVRCNEPDESGADVQSGSRADEEQGLPQLSPRESEIARMVAKGYPNKTIASVLEISAWTVSSHLRRIFSKLGVTTRAAMVARLLEQSPGSESGLAGR